MDKKSKNPFGVGCYIRKSGLNEIVNNDYIYIIYSGIKIINLY